jgi:hypothetical protein
MSVEAHLITADPQVGEPVQFRIVATDDSQIDRDCIGALYGDDKDPYCSGTAASCPGGPAAYGPWSPPEKQPDRYEATFSHIYDNAGTYTASFTVRSYKGCTAPSSPYRSEGTGTVTFTVKA